MMGVVSALHSGSVKEINPDLSVVSAKVEEIEKLPAIATIAQDKFFRRFMAVLLNNELK